MRVVAYIRVSTDKQSSEGASPDNQKRNALGHAVRGGHEIIRVYEESASAGTVAKRRIFQRMLDELAETQPDCIVVDSSDRFSRNLEDALQIVERLRENRIKIWPLDWDRTEAPNTLEYDGPDYLRFRDEIIAAQHERKRIKTRVKRSYAGRRERGATTHNRGPFGTRKEGDRLMPSSEAWIVVECDRRILAGDSLRSVRAWAAAAHERAWKSLALFRRGLTNDAYVQAGVRSPETAERLRLRLAANAERFGEMRVRKHASEWTGVFRCARCAYKMPVHFRRGAERIFCDRAEAHSYMSVTANARIAEAWRTYLGQFNVHFLEQWASGDDLQSAEVRRGLQRQLAAIDEQAADATKRRDRAFDLLVDGDPAIEEQAKNILRQVNADDTEREMRRAMIATELATVPPPRSRDGDALRQILAAFPSLYEAADARKRNRFNRMLCDAVGGHPILGRDAERNLVVSWPAVDAYLVPA